MRPLLFLAFATAISAPVAAQEVYVLPEPHPFSIRARDLVRPVLVNDTDATVYLAVPSFDTELERWEGGEWVALGAWYVIGGIGPNPRAIAPGETYPLPSLRLDPREPVPLEPGQRYRFRTLVYDAAVVRVWDGRGPMASRSLFSEPFQIVE